MFNDTRTVLSGLTNFTEQATLWLRDGALAHCRLTVRYAFTGSTLFFMQLIDRGNALEWKLLLDNGLLKPNEHQTLLKLSPDERVTLLFHWSMQVAAEGHLNTNQH